jgi:antitoxin component YwqK of YwqJK toxin-antitoxin module
MKAFLFLLLCCISGSLFSQDTLIIYYDKDWKEIPNKEDAVFYRKAFPGINKSWSVRDYYISNKLQMTGTYSSKKMEKKHGSFINYHENGQVSSEGQYVKDKLEGKWTNYFENGQLQSMGMFTKNFLNGISVTWYENGQKKSEGNSVNGLKEGKWIYYYPDGVVQSEEEYENEPTRICKCVGYHENGVVNYKGDMLNGLTQGEWAYYNADGRLFFKGIFNKGRMEGTWTRYFPEDTMQLEYKMSQYIGKPLGGIAGRD